MFSTLSKKISRFFGGEPGKQEKAFLKLSRADRKKVEAVIRAAKSVGKNQLSAQKTIGYERMWPDGLCEVTPGHYTKMILFQDLNYRLAQQEDQDTIFDGWCEFLNYFDPIVRFQISFHNLRSATPEHSVVIAPQEDGFNDAREEYNGVILQQMAKGNNGQSKTKYLTFGIDADNPKVARTKLQRIEMNILHNFHRLGVATHVLDGKERLKVLYDIFHTSQATPFSFKWEWLAASGLSTQDFIAPSGFYFRTGRRFQMGDKHCAVSCLQFSASELDDQLLAEILEMDDLIVSIQVKSVDQAKAIKMVKRKMTDIDRAKIEEQMKAVRSGYDMDILPANLAASVPGAKSLLESLQNENKRYFMTTVLFLHMSEDEQKLENNIFQTQTLLQQYGYTLMPLDYQQEQGLTSCLPLGNCAVHIERGLTTNALAAFIPLTAQ